MIREKRATRGLRMNELVGEDADKDKAFWEHNTWAEDEDDSENDSFEEEEIKPDVFDDDFNDTEDDESSSDEENERVASKRSKNPHKKNTYKEPAKKKMPSSNPSERKKTVSNDMATHIVDAPTLQLRHSTKTKSLEHEKARKEAIRVARPRVPHRVLPQGEFTQKSLLFESLDTEILNAKWLHSQQMAEEERAMSDKPTKTRTEIITHLSRKGTYNTITFCEERWPEIFERNAPPEIPDVTCVVTGKRARYRDASTGCPFYDLAALKRIRSGAY